MDLARHKRFTPPRALVVKKDPVAGIHPIALAVVDRDPIRIKLRDAVRTAWIERCALLLRNLLHQAVELAGAGLVDPRFFREPQDTHCLKNPQHSQCITVGGVLRALKAHRYVALGAEVIDLIRLHLLDDPNQVGAVSEVAVVEGEPGLSLMRILVKVIDPGGVETACTPLDPVHLLVLLQKELCQITAILACNACNQSGFRRGHRHRGGVRAEC